jgi:hypothetical protein
LPEIGYKNVPLVEIPVLEYRKLTKAIDILNLACKKLLDRRHRRCSSKMQADYRRDRKISQEGWIRGTRINRQAGR